MGWRRREGGGAVAGAASRLRFAPSSNHLLVSSWDSGLRLYDADACELRMEAKSEAALLDCCFQDEAVALTGGSDGSITRYDLHSGAQGTIGQHHEVVSCIEFSQITGQVVTATLDKKLMFWDSQTRNVNPNSIKNLDSDVASLSVCEMYILAAIEREVYIYDMRNLIGPVKVKDSPVEYHLRSLHSSPEWKGYAAGSVDGVVAVKYFDRGTDGDMGDKTFVTGDNEGYVIAWDAQSKKKLHEFPIYSGSVASIAFNHNGQIFAVASNSNYQESDKICNHVMGRGAPDIFRNEAALLRRYIVTGDKHAKVGFWGRLEMSDSEEHHFESKADAGASKTYPQQAGTIRKNGHIVIKNRPCKWSGNHASLLVDTKVVEVSTSKTGKHGHAKCHFVAIDIFNGKKLEDIVPSSHNCDVPHVNRTDYQLIDISEDGFVSLLTESGGTKDDLRLPSDEALLTQIKDGFAEGKDLIVTVMSAMGEEQICALKDIGPKN
ncbi:hypothetical protein OsJ_12660 [Oryza sativa Japonica Group]|uniref:Translation initiation factor 5A C-terminal domain-containing protein n=1 Tax=Oryza sativa subsp. japonica TaxID=39947 RepID=B9F5T2_ORYSJ|nr:hypothetical protein OsJ_12660 [Oryza sativa Japonica Group]